MKPFYRSFGLLLAAATLGLPQLSSAALLAPVNPNATAKAKAVYTYLQNIKGQSILSGQESMLWDKNDAGSTTYSTAHPYSFRDVYAAGKNGGKYPAIYESDFGDVNTGNGVADRQRVVDIIKARAPKGTIFMLNWHTANPASPDGAGYDGAKTLTNSAAIIDSMLKPGTAYNVEWLKRLDIIAGYLKQLQDADIVVMWRPFHENNGSFFWWGQQPRFKELWSQMYHRFTDTAKLNNLLWVYNSNHFGSGDAWVRKNYPGDTLVDILGVDIYHPSFNFEKTMYDTLMAIGKGKPVGITENGRMPDVPKLFEEGQQYVFWVTWWGFESGDARNDGMSNNPDSLYTRNYSSEYTVTEDEIDLNTQPDGKKVIGVTAAQGGSVTVSKTGRIAPNTVVTLTAVPEAGYTFGGWSGDTTVAASVNPLLLTVTRDRSIKALFTPAATTNILVNGSFSDKLTGWSFSAWDKGAAATAVAEGTDNVLHVNVTALGSYSYGIQLTQSLALDSGVTYTLSYDVRGAAGAAITYAVGESSGKYRKLLNKDLTLASSTVQNVSTAFLDTLPSSSSLRLEFNLAAQKGDLYLDNIKITRSSDIVTSIAASAARLAGPSRLSLNLRGSALSWSVPAALVGEGMLRVLDAQGRELAHIAVPAGSRNGSLEVPGQGLRLVALESSQGSLSALIPAMR